MAAENAYAFVAMMVHCSLANHLQWAVGVSLCDCFFSTAVTCVDPVYYEVQLPPHAADYAQALIALFPVFEEMQQTAS